MAFRGLALWQPHNPVLAWCPHTSITDLLMLLQLHAVYHSLDDSTAAGAGPEGGAPSKPQEFVWNGRNKHDTLIPDTHGSSTRMTQRQQAAQAEEQQDPYLSSAKVSPQMPSPLQYVPMGSKPSITTPTATLPPLPHYPLPQADLPTLHKMSYPCCPT